MNDLEISIVRSHATDSGRLSPVSIHGLSAWTALALRCEARGWSFRLDGATGRAKQSVTLWDFGSIATRPRIPAEGSVVAWSLESPLVAHRAYHRIDSIASESDLVLGFPGVGRLLGAGRDRFRPLFWPNGIPEQAKPTQPWSDRRLAVIINSNKNVDSLRGQLSLRDPYRSARRLAAATLASTYKMRGSWTVPNLYRDRLEMIEAFASDPGFDVYGVGWDRPVVGAPRGFREALAGCYRGVAGDKHETLANYRFALCLENTRFPGYISEKLFDCFFTGTIPVYLGAPDIDEYVPEEAYVRVESFQDHDDLLANLRSMDGERAEQALAAARDFLASLAFERFTEEHFVTTMMDAIDSVVGGSRG